MPSKNPERRLADIVENAAAIASYIEGLDAKAFSKDRMRRDAVERCLQRISEAALKLGSDAERFDSLSAVETDPQPRKCPAPWIRYRKC